MQQTAPGAAATPAPIRNFEGLSDDDNAAVLGFRVVPPDTEGDVGTSHYVQAINLLLAVYDKATGNRIFGPVPTDTLWSGFGGICETNNDGEGFDLLEFDQIKRFGWVYEDRLFMPAKTWIGAEDIELAVRCGVSLVFLDLMALESSKDGNDTRHESAIWSWQRGDFDTTGDAALLPHTSTPALSGRYHRWVSADPAESHHFACARPRAESGREPRFLVLA